MEIPTTTVTAILSCNTDKGKGKTKKNVLIFSLIEILIDFPKPTITLEEIEALEEITARQRTWLRQIFNFKLV